MRDIQSNSFLKAIGVVLLVALGACTYFFGAVSMAVYNWGVDETTSFFDSQYCANIVDNDVIEYWWQIADIDYSEIKDSDFEDFKQRLGENYDIAVSKYNSKTDTYDSIQDFSTDAFALTKTYGISDRDHTQDNNIYSVSEEEITNATTNAHYILQVGIKETLVKNSYLEQQYQAYNAIVPYASDAFVATVACGLSVLLLLIYEMNAAGHVANKDGITLSYFDKIPFDVLTCVMGLIMMMIIFIPGNMISSASTSRYIVRSFVLISSILTLASLVFYFYLISFAVRLKSHTLIKNNLISLGIIKIYHMIQNTGHKIYRVYHNSASGYRKVIIALCSASVLHLLIMLMYFDRYYVNTFVYLLLWGLMIAEGIGIAILVKLNADVKPILDASKQLSQGNLEYRISDTDLQFLHGPLLEHAEQLNAIGEGMSKAIQNELKSEKMKAELITNVSHDIKTPLTSIINYVDLLSKEQTPEKQKEYLEVLKRQSQRLKKLTEDVVEASKATSGAMQVHMETVSMNELLEQALAEYEEKFQQNHLQVIKQANENIQVYADGRLLWRVLRNLLSNVAKYAMEGSRVYIELQQQDGTVITTIKNTSRNQLNISEDELMQRFVRGDASRHTEGSGLGLSIAQSLTELMQGQFKIVIDGDLFKSQVILKGVNEKA